VEKLAKIVTGAGNDDVELYNVFTNLLTIITCSGDDEVYIGVGNIISIPDVANKAVIDTGKGKDDVHIGAESFFPSEYENFFGVKFNYLTVLMGVNQDCLAIGNTLVRTCTVLNGGLAEDNFDDNGGNSFMGRYKELCFEYFEDCEEEMEEYPDE